jgi:hypothetical protein
MVGATEQLRIEHRDLGLQISRRVRRGDLVPRAGRSGQQALEILRLCLWHDLIGRVAQIDCRHGDQEQHPGHEDRAKPQHGLE